MTFTPTTNDPLIGKILAERYRITELVGAGRFSIVYKGQHLFMDRSVAMKTLQSNLVEDQTVIKRFEKEAVALSKLRHPNIVSVYDCFVHSNGQPFLVMDFLDGHTLEELLTDRGAIPPKLMRAIIFQASAGLAHAHASGVLHRDIKPDNIILLPREKTDERVRLLDFGFALLQGDLERLTLSGTLCGSPAYISPERWKGKELDARSDIYSLAVVMFQGLTGTLPFKASSLEDLRNMHVSQEPPLLCELMPSLVEDIVAQQIMNKALAKDPDDRYQTMKEFHNAIKGWSPNSDDAEIANWAKNATPKPPPPVMSGQPAIAQPVSLQPMPPQAVPQNATPQANQSAAQQSQVASPQGQAPAQQGPAATPEGLAAALQGQAPGQAPTPQVQTPAPHPGQGQRGSNTLRLPAAEMPASAGDFDDAETLPNNSGPGFNDAATVPTNQDQTLAAPRTLPTNSASDANLSALTADVANAGADANNVDPSEQHKGFISVDLNQHPLSPEALSRIAKPNPRASLTKQDVAYIKAIAQTLGDSLGEQAKSIDVPPNLEEELHIAPMDETSRLNFSAMPRPVAESTVPEPGPKVVPIVDRRQKRTGDGTSDTADNPPIPGSSWGVVDGAPSPLPGPKPAVTSAPASGDQPPSSEWIVKQEVAPWVSNPDEFKPKPGFDSVTPGAPATTQSPSFGTPASPDPPGSFGALQHEASGSPQPSFGAPQPTFGSPQQSLGSPQPASGSPQQSLGSPQQSAGSQQPSFGASQPSFGSPQPPGALQGAFRGTEPSGPTEPRVGIGAFGTPIQPQPPEQPPAPAPAPPPASATTSSSRISPVLPGSPLTLPGSQSGSPAGDSVPWTNATSSAPVDFGKMFPDSEKSAASGSPNLAPGVPGQPASQAGTEIASPTANASNLSVSAGSDRPQPPSGKKRNRLPTFVDRDMPEDGSEAAAAPPKKGNAGMLIAGVAVAIFVFAGIGIATWMITNVNPANNPANSPDTTNSTTAPADTSTAPSTSSSNPPAKTTDSGADTTAPTASATSPSGDKDTSPADTASDTANNTDTNTGTKASAPADSNSSSTNAVAPPSKPAVTATKPPPKTQPAKEPPQSNGWFGFPSFNKNNAAAKPDAAPTVATHEQAAPPPRPKKKKPKKKPRAAVARKAAPSASSGGYVEVEVTPGRRAYRSY